MGRCLRVNGLGCIYLGVVILLLVGCDTSNVSGSEPIGAQSGDSTIENMPVYTIDASAELTAAWDSMEVSAGELDDAQCASLLVESSIGAMIDEELSEAVCEEYPRVRMYLGGMYFEKAVAVIDEEVSRETR
ncbi:MAG: hypothetical protein ACOC2Y_06620 [Spirochaetota bacterium]